MSLTSSSSSFSTSDIVGIAIGGVIGLIMVISLIFSCYTMCCKKNKPAQVSPQFNPYYPPNGGYGQQMNTGYYPQQPPYQQPPWNKQPINNDQPPAYSSVYPGNNQY
jgi:hypothetical protein